MTKDRILGIIRTLLGVVGAFLIGKNFFGNPIDEVLWEGILGAGMTLIGLVWSVVDKSATVEKLQSGIRQVILFVGGFLVATGKLKPENLETIIGFITVLATYLYGRLSRNKTQQLQSGEISLKELKS